MKLILLALSTTLALSGCGSLSGIADSNGKFACKAPDGVSCTSVSGVYANAQQNNLPALLAYRKSPTPTVAMGTASQLPVALPGMAIRSQPKTLRIWFSPWSDEDDDLHDQTYVYVTVDHGRWLLEHSREATVRKTLTRLQALGNPTSSTSSSAATQQQAIDPQQAAVEAAVVPGTGEGDIK